MTDCVIRSRISPEVKAKAVKLFDKMGLTLSEAIRLFIFKSVSEQSIPFSINIPNEKTIQVFKETDSETNIVKAKNTDEMFNSLGI